MSAKQYSTVNSNALDLLAGCKLWDILPHLQAARTLVLACPGVDAIRLSPLPVEHPWDEDGSEGKGKISPLGKGIISGLK